MIANGNSITVSALIALPETHPARALYSAYLGKELSVENFNFCKAVAATLKQTDPVVQNAMIKNIANHANVKDLNITLPQLEKMNTLFTLSAAR